MLHRYSIIALLGSACSLGPADQARLDGPTHAVTGTDGTVFVADGYGNSRIAVFDADGRFVRSFGSRGFGAGQLLTPHSLAFGPDGSLYVADRDNARIQRFRTDGIHLETIAPAGLGRPWGISITAGGDILSVDGGDQNPDHPRSGIVRLDRDRRTVSRFSSWGSGPGQLDWGHAIVTDQNGDNAWVVDFKNSRLQKFTNIRSNPTHAAGWPSEPPAEFTPLGIALQQTTIHVCQDGAGKPILLFDAESGTLRGSYGAGIFRRAHGIHIASDGSVWVADVAANRIVNLTTNGTILRILGDSE